MFNQPLGVSKVVAGIDTAQSSSEVLHPTRGKRNWNKGCMENPLPETYVETKHFWFLPDLERSKHSKLMFVIQVGQSPSLCYSVLLKEYEMLEKSLVFLLTGSP